MLLFYDKSLCFLLQFAAIYDLMHFYLGSKDKPDPLKNVVMQDHGKTPSSELWFIKRLRLNV